MKATVICKTWINLDIPFWTPVYRKRTKQKKTKTRLVGPKLLIEIRYKRKIQTFVEIFLFKFCFCFILRTEYSVFGIHISPFPFSSHRNSWKNIFQLSSVFSGHFSNGDEEIFFFCKWFTCLHWQRLELMHAYA